MKETFVPQLALPFRNSTGVDDVSDAVLANKPTFLSAINLCVDVSGLLDDQVAEIIGTSPGNYSKYKSGKYHFPSESYIPLMNACGNLIPLRWLALKAGHKIEPLRSTVEAENEALRAENEALRRDFAVAERLIAARANS